MGREVFFLHFGQAGIQLGSALWELFCYEHAIDISGVRSAGDILPDQSGGEHVDTFFSEGVNTWTPRALLVDLEPTVIDEIRSGAYRRLWRPQMLISGKEDASNNYGRGNYTIGRLKLDATMEAIRQTVEDTNNLAAFNIVHSYSGGTGSGMTSLIMDELTADYGKKLRFASSVFPSSMYSQSTVDSYNAVLHTNSTIENLDCGILFDNQTLYERFTKNLDVANPSFTNINRLLAQMFTSVFLAHRFVYYGSQHADTTELLTNLVPYPRIHFPVLSFAPLQSHYQVENSKQSVHDLTRGVFHESSQTLDFPCRTSAYISCAVLYRGLTSPRSVYDAIKHIKGGHKTVTTFVDWCPTGFKIGLNSVPPMTFPDSPIGYSERSACMLAGNLGIQEAWHRMNIKFDLLYSRRAFLHWFVSEGVEEGEFSEARENIASLEQDYLDLMKDIDQLDGPSAGKAIAQANENNFLAQPGIHPAAISTQSSYQNRNDRKNAAMGDNSARSILDIEKSLGSSISRSNLRVTGSQSQHKQTVPQSSLKSVQPMNKGVSTVSENRARNFNETGTSTIKSTRETSEFSNSVTSNVNHANDKNRNNPRMWGSTEQWYQSSPSMSYLANYGQSSSELQSGRCYYEKRINSNTMQSNGCRESIDCRHVDAHNRYGCDELKESTNRLNLSSANIKNVLSCHDTNFEHMRALQNKTEGRLLESLERVSPIRSTHRHHHRHHSHHNQNMQNTASSSHHGKVHSNEYHSHHHHHRRLHKHIRCSKRKIRPTPDENERSSMASNTSFIELDDIQPSAFQQKTPVSSVVSVHLQ